MQEFQMPSPPQSLLAMCADGGAFASGPPDREETLVSSTGEDSEFELEAELQALRQVEEAYEAEWREEHGATDGSEDGRDLDSVEYWLTQGSWNLVRGALLNRLDGRGDLLESVLSFVQ